MITVVSPVARSLIIITSLRFQRSASTPAKGVRAMRGRWVKKIISEKVVTSPVCW